jgi:hypothetical protein
LSQCHGFRAIHGHVSPEILLFDRLPGFDILGLYVPIVHDLSPLNLFIAKRRDFLRAQRQAQQGGVSGF